MKQTDFYDIMPDVILPSSINLDFYKDGKLFASQVACTIVVSKQSKTTQNKYKENIYLGRKNITFKTTQPNLRGCTFLFSDNNGKTYNYYIKNEHEVSLTNKTYWYKYVASQMEFNTITFNKETTMECIDEEDVGAYIKSELNIEKNNIYCGYKQNVDAQDEQMNNLFNVSVFLTNSQLCTNNFQDDYREENNNTIHTIQGIYDVTFSISVFNWYQKGAEESNNYDCRKDAIHIYSLFRNKGGFRIQKELQTKTLVDNNTGSTCIIYTFAVVVRDKITITTKTNHVIIKGLNINNIITKK